MQSSAATREDPTFLRDTDFAGIVTPARGVPTATAATDELIVWCLAKRRILVDTGTGIVYRADGVTRAEIPQPTGFGRIYLGRFWGKVRYAQAHRVVWVAKHGPIPGNYRVTQMNGRPWDNRIDNLTIATHSEVMRRERDYYLGPDVNGPDDPTTIHPYATSCGRVAYTRARRSITD